MKLLLKFTLLLLLMIGGAIYWIAGEYNSEKFIKKYFYLQGEVSQLMQIETSGMDGFDHFYKLKGKLTNNCTVKNAKRSYRGVDNGRFVIDQEEQPQCQRLLNTVDGYASVSYFADGWIYLRITNYPLGSWAL